MAAVPVSSGCSGYSSGENGRVRLRARAGGNRSLDGMCMKVRWFEQGPKGLRDPKLDPKVAHWGLLFTIL